jgi:hypothetical protein
MSVARPPGWKGRLNGAGQALFGVCVNGVDYAKGPGEDSMPEASERVTAGTERCRCARDGTAKPLLAMGDGQMGIGCGLGGQQCGV